ncbi:hypothetical protein GCM10027614_29140 [Micromonospora vulcania]
MTARLRDALHGTADGVPAYPVYERALATARRSRRRRTAAAVGAVVLLALAGVTVPVTRTPALDPAATDAALPDRIGLPPIGTPHATDRPRLGPASVIFSGTAPRLRGWNDASIVGVVSAASDRYRILPAGRDASAGETVRLSPTVGIWHGRTGTRTTRGSTSSTWSRGGPGTSGPPSPTPCGAHRSAGPPTALRWSSATRHRSPSTGPPTRRF